jgi:sialate O-acetylesterase
LSPKQTDVGTDTLIWPTMPHAAVLRRSFLRRPLRCLVAFPFLALALNCFADPTLPYLLTDHMVLQQGRPIHLWGTADPTELITVTLVANTVSATTDATGHWSVNLPAMPAGGPFTIHIQGKKEILIKDVLIGEVWVASGQSNMTFSLDAAVGAAEEIPKANYPEIRLFTVPKKIALSPQENTLPGAWQLCTPDTAKSFSAVAYFFAKYLHHNLHVPIGIIHSSWPGTTAESWTDAAYLQTDPELKPLWDEWQSSSAALIAFAECPAEFRLEFDDFQLLHDAESGLPPVPFVNFDDATSHNSLGGNAGYDWPNAPNTIFDLVSPGRGHHGYAARLSGTLDGTQESILAMRYHLDDSPVDLSSYAGIRFWERGKGKFRFRSHQPTITDYDNYATTIMNATSDWQPVTIWFRDLKQEDWGVTRDFTPAALTGFSFEALTTMGDAPMPVSALYEGMITPLLSYAFRGAIWYQGESNASRGYQYRKLLPALIESWRSASQQPDMDFLIVQLPNHGAIPTEPTESVWAETREAEFLTMKSLPHTGMAVTIDVGDPSDVHPHRNREVGERLARWALGTTYSQPIVYSGPLYESMKVEGSQIRIHFAHVGSGLQARGASGLRGFAIAGADRKFHWGNARIDGDTVLVSHPEVPIPVAVRYAWADSPPCNLFNIEGLPASPFRTDDWPGISTQK